jgi:hypothetical protein
MKILKASCAVACVLLLGGIAEADGVVVYDQPAESPFNTRASQFFPSTGSFGFTVFDNFTLTATAAIGEVGWQGSYVDTINLANNPATPNSTGFGIEFFADNAGVPGALLAGDTYGLAAVNETFAGLQPNSIGSLNLTIPFFNYNVALSSPFVAQAGVQYWLRIYSLSPLPAANEPQWAWNSSAVGDQQSLQFLGSDFFAQVNSDRAFTLVAVPEPSTLLLTLTGFGLLGACRLRQQRIVSTATT